MPNLMKNNESVNEEEVALSSLITSNKEHQECRRIAISCEEMVLFHRESGIPNATLFSGNIHVWV